MTLGKQVRMLLATISMLYFLGAIVSLIFNQTDSSDSSLSYVWDDIESAILTALGKWPSVLYSIGPFKDRVVEITLKDTEGDGSSASGSVCDIRKQMSFS